MPYYLRDQPEAIERVIVHLGVDLRASRLRQFETQTHLSQIGGVSQSTWSMIENGLAEGVRLETLARVAASMGLEVVLRPCEHPPGTDHRPASPRERRLNGATRIIGTRALRPGPDWRDW
jgi:DNA-binding Xre family transcriptional regulator